MKAGDKIRLQLYTMGYPSNKNVFVVEEFRFCLGIFLSQDARAAEHFTPLCELYKRGPDSTDKYMSNYGEYYTNAIPDWENVT